MLWLERGRGSKSKGLMPEIERGYLHCWGPKKKVLEGFTLKVLDSYALATNWEIGDKLEEM